MSTTPPPIKRIAISTGGGDAPGLNAVIRAAVLAGRNRGWDVVGIRDGFNGLMYPDQYPAGGVMSLSHEAVRGIVHLGGTIIGTTNRGNPTAYPVQQPDGTFVDVDRTDELVQMFRDAGIDALITIGGDGSLTIGNRLHEAGLRVIGVPKTIDNDLDKTHQTFGFDTAVSFASECIDRLFSTATSHGRVIVVEVMGRYAGWIALESGIASSAHAILIPEIPFELEPVAATIAQREARGAKFSIVVVAEGAAPKGGSVSVLGKAVGQAEKLGGIGSQVAARLEELTGKESRVVVLGHLLRGGSPTAFDRLLGLRFGAAAVRGLDTGHDGVMVALNPPTVDYVPLVEATNRMKSVPLDCDSILTARDLGINFGDRMPAQEHGRCDRGAPVTHDLVIRDAWLVDGTGAPRAADVAVDGETITAVEPAGTLGPARRSVDAAGRLVTPGFVDIHTHYDAQATWDPYLTPSGWHGVTTVVMGNCGVGFAPAAPDRHDWLIQLMEGVEDIPGSALTEGITWGWETFPEYLDALAGMPRAIDAGVLVGHGPVRAYVMGERGAANEAATGDDVAAMAGVVEAALNAGAFGFSTSRTPLHRARDGELVPGTDAAAGELLGIAAAIRRAGHGVFQFAPDHARVPVEEWPWMRQVAELTGQPVSVNVNQPDSAPEVWREVLTLLDQAHADGLSIVAQVAGRTIGILYCLQGSVHPLLFHPAYQEVASLPLAARLRELADPERRRRLIHDLPDDGGFFERVVVRGAEKMWLTADGAIDYEPSPDSSIAALARARGVPPTELIVDQLCALDGNGMIYAPFFNYAYGDLSFSYEANRHVHTRNGLSDAGAHCGAICDGGVPTFMLTHWTRDRTRGPRLALEHVVHRQTAQTAALYGLTDRGVIAPGRRADVNLIDFDALTFGPARMAYDLPAGGRRLVQRASGYVGTWVAGTQTVADDEFTGELPGRLLRAGR